MAISRRNFLTYAGIGTAAALAGRGTAKAPTARSHVRIASPDLFKPIAPSPADELRIPSGFKYDVICSRGDALGSTGPLGPETAGDGMDFLAFFPMDALVGGAIATDGLLWMNNEYVLPQLVSKYDGVSKKTEPQILAEKAHVGGGVIRVTRENGVWRHKPGSKYARRYCASYPEFTMTGPVAAIIPTATGTFANCSGGRTLWNTVLSCEENYHEANAFKYRWNDVPGQAMNLDGYGWIVEVDPFGDMRPMKHSCLGRFAHENAAMRLGSSGKLIVYMGDDKEDQCFYKFVSAEPYRAGATRAECRKLLEQGTLYAGDFANGKWLPIDIVRSPELKEKGFKDQADVLIRTREAAKALGATSLDRPEDCEVHPRDGSVYIALTNNLLHGNFYGQIVRLIEKGDDAEAESFHFEIFLVGGPQSGLACPDNLVFDRKGNLWVVTDITGSKLNKGCYSSFGNNGMFFVPTSGKSAGDAFQFASGPIESELTGPWFTENNDTLFLSVQHPGEQSKLGGQPTSRWPRGGGDEPRSSVVAITGF